MSKYFDVHSFLAEQETVPVVFNSGCTGLGKEMDKQCDGHDLPSYAEVMLPFWLVPKLFEQNMVAPSPIIEYMVNSAGVRPFKSLSTS